MTPGWLILLLVSGAGAIGLLANGWLRRRQPLEGSGFGAKDLLGPVTTLAVVLMAFVLTQSLASFGRARENAGNEARLVNEMSEAALRLNDSAAGSRVQVTLSCYARAVRHHEWGPMDHGDRSVEVSRWADGLEHELAQLKRAGGDDAEVGRLVELDSQRAAARVERVNESSPTNPNLLRGMMLGTVIVSITGLGMFASVSGPPAVRVGILTVLATVLGCTLYLIDDLDQPFAGFDTVRPVEMQHIQERVDQHLDRASINAPEPGSLPCDDEGVPF